VVVREMFDGCEMFDGRSDAEVRDAIIGLHQRFCLVHRELLGAIAEHDRRQAFSAYGSSSEEGFLVRELALQWRTARDWVKVAHALDRNPGLGDSFAAGEISIDQLIPLVEVMAHDQPGSTDPLGPFDDPTPPDPVRPDPSPDPSPDPGPSPDPDPDAGPDRAADGGGQPECGLGGSDDPMVLAGQLSAAQLAALARRLRRRSTADALAAHRRQRVEIVDIADGTGVHFEGELYDDAALALRAALDEYLRDVTKDPLTGRYPPVEHSQAEALIEMALAWLSGHERDADRPAIFVHADARVLSGDDGWAESAYGALAAETIRRMACYCHLSLTGEHDGPDPLRLGRSQRLPTWQQREMVRRRDGGCRFPGCRRNRWTQAHHVREWDAHHGFTDYENLACLCRRHHHMVHEGGWKMIGQACGELTFTSPDHTITLTSWPDPLRPVARPPDPPPHRTARPTGDKPGSPPDTTNPSTEMTDSRRDDRHTAPPADQLHLVGV